MGRPTKYKKEFCKEVDKYIETCSVEQMEIATREGFAIYLGFLADKITFWCKKHKEFRKAVKKIDDIQKKGLINLGLFGGKEVNGSMAIFLLKANHGMIETEKKMLVGADGKNLKGLIQVNEDDKSI